MKLTDRAINNIKPSDKIEKYYDGGGLHLAVSPSGVKSWRYSYSFQNRQKLLTIGQYPSISLAMAREKLLEAKGLLAQGIDPAQYKQEVKKLVDNAVANTLEKVAKEWHLKYLDTWTEKHGKDIWHRLDKNVLKFLGKTPISTIKPAELLSILRRIEARGALEQAHRVMQICSNVFRYAVSTGRAEHDITADLRGAIPPNKVKHLASLTEPKDVICTSHHLI